jgi:hypothetical protein
MAGLFLWTSLNLAGITGEPQELRSPAEVAGLVAFWDFHEPGGSDRVAAGEAYRLAEVNGPIDRDEEGPFGPHSARLEEGQWFRIPRSDCPRLDFRGKEATFTVIAWVKRAVKEDRWQAVAGMWDETRDQRQYCLFLDAERKTRSGDLVRRPCRDLVHGHVSAVGGPTPGKNACVTYASGATPIPLDEWHSIAMSYDGLLSRVYVDGRLDSARGFNPFAYPGGIFEAGEGGADFTVGSVSVRGKPGHFFVGRIGGLALYDRALPDEEMQSVAGQGAPLGSSRRR